MSDLHPSADYMRRLAVACSIVLTRPGSDWLVNKRVHKDGRIEQGWNSAATARAWHMTLDEYRKRFGPEPSWLQDCQMSHQHALRVLALSWGAPLPSVSPGARATPENPGDAPKLLPPKKSEAGRSSQKAVPVEVSLEKAMPRLARSAELRDILRKRFGEERYPQVLKMLRAGKPDSDIGDELWNFLADGIANDYWVAWEAETPSDYYDGVENWRVEIRCYHGVFEVWAAERGTTGLFLDERHAKAYILTNWGRVVSWRERHGRGQ